MPLSEIHLDPLLPRLAEGTPESPTTEEQRLRIREILDLCCSDSRFADKAYVAILLVLGPAEVMPIPPVNPTIGSLTPASVEVGGPDFTLVVTGTGFTPTSVVYVRGNAVATTFVSETELNVMVETALIVAPGTAPVMVIDNGRASNSVDFTVVAAPLP